MWGNALPSFLLVEVLLDGEPEILVEVLLDGEPEKCLRNRQAYDND